MHEHDQDLIMALAEGTLATEDAAAARSEIEACSECAPELEQQAVALRFLRAAPSVRLSEFERARLRRDVSSQLEPPIAPAVVRSTRDRRRFRLVAALGAAAVLIAVVAVAPNLGVFGGSDDSTADFDDISVALAPETSRVDSTAAAAEEPAAERQELGVAEEFVEPNVAGGDSPSDTLDSPTDGAADVTSTTAAADTPPPTYTVYRVSEIEPPLDVAALGESLRTAKSLDPLGLAEPVEEDTLARFPADTCYAVGAREAPTATEAYVIGIAGIDDVEVVVVAFVTGDFEDVAVMAQDLETCEILDHS